MASTTGAAGQSPNTSCTVPNANGPRLTGAAIDPPVTLVAEPASAAQVTNFGADPQPVRAPASPVTAVRYGILGPVALADAATARLEPVRSRQQAALLAFLLIHANVASSSDQLIEAIWQRPSKSERKPLQMAVKRLRDALQAHGAREPPLQTHGGGYLLAVTPGELDADVFERQTEIGRQALAEDRPEEAARLLRSALALWRGPALADIAYEDFVQGAIRRLDELRLVALEARIEAELELGRHAALAGELEALLAEHPTRERLAEHLMLAYYRCGRQSDALDVYGRVREQLDVERGTHPGAGLAAMQKQILDQSAALALPSAAARVTPGPMPLPAPLLASAAASRAFVGRDAQRAQLRASIAACSDGRQRCVWIAGEPGMGKTTLTAHAARHAEAAGFWVSYGAPAGEVGAPYGPWIGALSHLVEYAPEPLLAEHVAIHGVELARLAPMLRSRVQARPLARQSDPETQRCLLFNAVAGWLQALCRSRPLVLVLDDLQWADEASVALLAHVAASTRELPLLLLLAYRHTDPPVAASLLDLRGGLAEELELRGLDVHELMQLLPADAGEGLALAGRLHFHSGGNPFLAGELIRAWRERPGPLGADETPDSVRQIIARRVRRLGPQAEAILKVAAVIGVRFDFRLLEEVIGESDETLLTAIEAACDAAIVVETGDSVEHYAFVHALTRNALYEGLSGPRRTRTHRRVAEALERTSVPAASAEIYRHLIATEDRAHDARAARHARLAGERALAQLANADAARWFERALALEPGEEERCDTLIGLGEAQRRIGDAAFRDTLLAAGRLALARGDHERLSRAVIANTLGPFGSAGPSDEPRVAMLESALELVPPDWTARPRMLATLAREAYFGGDPARGERLSEDALALARRAGDRREIARVIAVTTAISPMTPLESHAVLVGELTALAEEIEDPELRFRAANAGFIWSMHSGDPVRLNASLLQMDALDAAIGQPILHWTALWAHSARQTLAGCLEEGEALTLEAEARAAAHGIPHGPLITFGQLLSVYTEWDRLDDLGDRLDRLIADNPRMPVLRLARGFIAAETGRLDDACAVLERAASVGFAFIFERTRAFDLARCADIALRVDDGARAAQLYERLLPYRGHFATAAGISSRGSIELVLGRLATALERYGLADQHLAAAARAHERLQAPLLQGRTALARGRSLAARGDAAAAAQELKAAARLARRHGAVALEREALAG